MKYSKMIEMSKTEEEIEKEKLKRNSKIIAWCIVVVFAAIGAIPGALYVNTLCMYDEKQVQVALVLLAIIYGSIVGLAILYLIVLLIYELPRKIHERLGR